MRYSSTIPDSKAIQNSDVSLLDAVVHKIGVLWRDQINFHRNSIHLCLTGYGYEGVMHLASSTGSANNR